MNPVEKRIAACLREQPAGQDALFGLELTPCGSPVRGLLEGQEVVLAGTNNYLGLTFHPELIAASTEATQKYGVGTTGSRMANGTMSEHVALEMDLCEFYGARSSLLFTTGFQANLAVISGLSTRDSILMLDSDCHASIYDGAKLSGATTYRFRHSDPIDLDRKLGRLGEKAKDTLIIVEGIYSMFGDSAPLREISEVAAQHGAALIVDEAHSFGVLGANGRGLAEQEGVEDKVDLIVGTFSKSAASVGGFCVSAKHDLRLLRRVMRAYIFSASMSPGIVAAARTAIRIIQREPELRTKLWHNAQFVYEGLAALGYEVGPEVSPVIAVTLPDAASAVKAWRQLVTTGVYVNLVLPPGAPDDKCLLRCSVSAAHSEADTQTILDAFKGLGNQFVRS